MKSVSIANLVLFGLFFILLIGAGTTIFIGISDRHEPMVKSPEDLMVEALVSEAGAAGVAVGIQQGSSPATYHIAGMADLEQNVGLERDTALRIGSVSKLFTATMIFQLIDAGKLTLDTLVTNIVPEFESGKEVTIRHLLAHTSGVRHYDFGNIIEANNMMPMPSLMAANGFVLSEPLLFPPGTAFHYTSLGYNILGIVIERITGQTYGEALREQIVEPLGLTSTTIDDALTIVPRRARHYTVPPKEGFMGVVGPNVSRINTFHRDASDYYPSGGIVTSVKDLMIFADALFRRDLLSAKLRAAMFAPGQTSDGIPTGWGHGVYLANDWMGHDGETNGAYGTVRYFPSADILIVGMSNTNFVGRSDDPFFDLIAQHASSF